MGDASQSLRPRGRVSCVRQVVQFGDQVIGWLFFVMVGTKGDALSANHHAALSSGGQSLQRLLRLGQLGHLRLQVWKTIALSVFTMVPGEILNKHSRASH